MRRSLLSTLTLVLLVLIVADRISQRFPRREMRTQVASGTNDSRAATAGDQPSAGVTHGADLPVRSATPTVDRLARLATRQQLTREAATTYLDSLMLSTDSVVRRWPDRYGSPLKVALVEGGVNGYGPRMAGFMRDALDRWENTAIGLRFETVHDTTGADVVVRWIDHFDIDRAGQTDLTWDQAGRVRRATISLAIRTNTGAALGDAALLAVAVHEVGHAIGLPHSGDTTDVMFPATRTGTLSDRDRRTVGVLYRLPPGPVRDLLAEGP
jgi:predicted Zn-dependent protease